jgi:cobalt-zinc-cadmium efflux system outer membrane protein
MGCTTPVRVFFALLTCGAHAALASDARADNACTGTLTLDDVLARAADAADVRALLRSAEIRRDTASSVPFLMHNPSLQASIGPRVTPLDEVGPEGGLTLSIPFDTGIGGQTRRRVLEAEAQATGAEGDARVRERQRAAARAYLELMWLAREEALYKDDLVLAERTRALVERALAAGLEDRIALHAARVREGEGKLALLDIEARIVEVRFALAEALSCDDANALVVVEHDFAARAGAIAADHPQAKDGERAPRVLAIEQEMAAARAREDHAGRARFPLADVGLTVEKDGFATGRVLAGAGVTIPIFERGQEERGRAASDHERLSGERERARAAFMREAGILLHDIEHAEEALALLENDVLPAARDAVTDGARALEIGELDALTLVRLERERLALEVRGLMARAERERAIVELTLLNARDAHGTETETWSAR